MPKPFHLVLIVASGVIIGACSGSEPESGSLDLGFEDSGQLLEIDSGQSIVLRLESNPGTGFAWEVGPFDQAVLLEQDREFVIESDLEGAPGLDVIRFMAVDSGRTDLELFYRRSWEVDVEPLRTFTVTVVVR